MNQSYFTKYFRPSCVDVAIAGATGVVGQRLLALCQDIPWINVVEICASLARKNQIFADICPWRDINAMPNHLWTQPLCDMNDISAPYILSCLPSDVAKIWEKKWAEKGHYVFSNADAFRMHPHVPLLIPEINAVHMACMQDQKTKGKIITNPNCSATGLALALAPILAYACPEHISIVTLQSISGAGYPGISSMDILGNTIPHIAGEAEKIIHELHKILQQPQSLFTVNVHRVPVLYGHVATVHIVWDMAYSISDIIERYKHWNDSFKTDLFVLHADLDRPQTRRDLWDNDMRVHIGPMIKNKESNVLQFNILSHNLVRGAAGAVLSNLQCFLEYMEHNA